MEGLTKMIVKSATEVAKLLEDGSSVRSVAATNMNAHSSRSHAIFTLGIRIHRPGKGETFSLLNLVDLAGSERATSTGATGDTLAEGANINKSLTTLGMCLSRLADQAEGKKGGHVPFRDSQLTWLLADSLGGNSRTAMLAALSPAHINYEETMSTLRFAETTKKIKQHAVINEDPQQRLIRELKAEIAEVKAQLKAIEEAGGVPADAGGKSKAELLQQLVDSTELFQEMTETEEEQLAKQKMMQKKRERGMAKLKEDNRIPVDTSIPRLHTLNEDMMRFPDIALLYYLHEGVTTFGSASNCTAILKLKAVDASAISPEHFHIRCNALNRELTIAPVVDSVTDECPDVYVNGELLTEDRRLKHMDRVLVGPLAFRCAVPVAWTLSGCEFNREPVDDTHAQLLGEYDELDSVVQKFTDLSKKQGEDNAVKAVPTIYQSKARLSEVETRLVTDYPVDERTLGTSLEQALQYDYNYALREKRKVAEEKKKVIELQQQHAAKDDDIDALMAELADAEAASKEIDSKYAAQQEALKAQANEKDAMEDLDAFLADAGAKPKPKDKDKGLADALADLGISDDDDDGAADSSAPQQGSGSASQGATSKFVSLDGAGGVSTGVVRDVTAEDEPPRKIVTSNASSASALSMKALLSKELLSYEDEVSASQQWKPDGPSIAEHRAEWQELSAKGATLLGNLLSKGNVDMKGGGLFKLRVKKTMFHSGGFHPVYAVLRGRFFYYFDKEDAKAGNLGSAYLYGAQILPDQPPMEDKQFVLKVIPTVPRKSSKSAKSITEENNLVLAFETEQLMQEWAAKLRKASLPGMSEQLAKFFGDDSPVPTSGEPVKKRRETKVDSDGDVKFTPQDKKVIEEFSQEEAKEVAKPADDAPIAIKAAEDGEALLAKMASDAAADTTANAARGAYAAEDSIITEEKPEVHQYKIPLTTVHNAKYLKHYFRTSVDGGKEWKQKQTTRMWLVDHFAKTVELIDIKSKIARVYSSRQVLMVEKNPNDPTSLKIQFFHHGFHPYEEHFLTYDDRERFYDTVQCIRPCIRVYCPPLVLGEAEDVVDSVSPIDGNGDQSMTLSSAVTGKQLTLSGDCSLRVSRELYEPISVWVGTLNLSGFPLQNVEVFQNWVPVGKYDLFAITVQEASYRTSESQFFDFVTKAMGKEYLTVATMDMYDTLLIVLARKRHLLKISNVEGSTCPSSIESLSGERGGVGISFRYLNTSFCFVAVHLPSQANRQDMRRFLLHEVLTGLQLGDRHCDLTAQFDHFFLTGDLGFPMGKGATLKALEDAAANRTFSKYVEQFDTLTIDRDKKRILLGFSEPTIDFAPTACMEVGTDTYNVAKLPNPAYRGRVLVKSSQPDQLKVVGYRASRRVTVSEHTPVSSGFIIQAIRPVATCFIPTPYPLGVQFNISTVIVPKSLDAMKPTLYVCSPSVFAPATLEDRVTFPPTGGYSWDGTDVLRFEMSTCVVPFLDTRSIFIAIYDRGEKDILKQHRGTAVLPLGDGKFDDSRKGKLQEATINLQKTGRVAGQLTVKFRWVPIE